MESTSEKPPEEMPSFEMVGASLEVNKRLAVLAASMPDLEKAMHLPAGLFLKILNEGDWSFVIQLHAIFETALASILAVRLNEPDLLDTFSRLEMGRVHTGKIAFAKRLKVITTEQAKYLAQLSEMRNDFAHNPENVGVNLKALLALMDRSQLKKFSVGISGPFLHVKNDPDDTAKVHGWALEIPKMMIWLSGLTVLHQLRAVRKECDLRALQISCLDVLMAREPKFLETEMKRRVDFAESVGALKPETSG